MTFVATKKTFVCDWWTNKIIDELRPYKCKNLHILLPTNTILARSYQSTFFLGQRICSVIQWNRQCYSWLRIPGVKSRVADPGVLVGSESVFSKRVESGSGLNILIQNPSKSEFFAYYLLTKVIKHKVLTHINFYKWDIILRQIIRHETR